MYTQPLTKLLIVLLNVMAQANLQQTVLMLAKLVLQLQVRGLLELAERFKQQVY
jgi:hypothetical protein